MMIPPPSLELVKKGSAKPKSFAIQSKVTCSSSVHAGEHSHYNCNWRMSRNPHTAFLTSTGNPGTHVETWVTDTRRVKLSEHTLKSAYSREIGKELTMLPMSDSWRDEFSVVLIELVNNTSAYLAKWGIGNQMLFCRRVPPSQVLQLKGFTLNQYLAWWSDQTSTHLAGFPRDNQASPELSQVVRSRFDNNHISNQSPHILRWTVSFNTNIFSSFA